MNRGDRLKGTPEWNPGCLQMDSRSTWESLGATSRNSWKVMSTLKAEGKYEKPHLISEDEERLHRHRRRSILAYEGELEKRIKTSQLKKDSNPSITSLLQHDFVEQRRVPKPARTNIINRNIRNAKKMRKFKAEDAAVPGRSPAPRPAAARPATLAYTLS
eukprot:TRINITY_DN22848_c0_g1_i1.p1 TRINITY_DN22848_c0_g1~~TRINITY_DN22848_c0_g1_i1.p1  ORF type:complete len:160 (+),score=14.76 TRINITY_DN22848_c0_g1_i1:46-525(+)